MQKTVKMQNEQQTLKNTIEVAGLFPAISCQYQHLLSSFTAENESYLNEADLFTPLCSINLWSELWSEVINGLQYGILIVTQEGRLLYANSTAQKLCQSLLSPDKKLPILPNLIVEICDYWCKATFSGAESFVTECLGREQQTIRAKAHNLYQYTKQNRSHTKRSNEAPILVLLEDCDERFKAELLIECKQYVLTEREAEVWNLFRRGHTYQEAAEILNVSVNTIKTHAKHIYSKKQHYQQDRKFSSLADLMNSTA